MAIAGAGLPDDANRLQPLGPRQRFEDHDIWSTVGNDIEESSQISGFADHVNSPSGEHVDDPGPHDGLGVAHGQMDRCREHAQPRLGAGHPVSVGAAGPGRSHADRVA